jgi:puromycin-sensitive aminopeptidase
MDAYRLPRTVTPRHYAIELQPKLHAGQFTGAETIEVTVHEPVSEIVLNAADLALHSAEFSDSTGAVRTAAVTLDEPAERARLAFPSPIAPGAGRLSIAFSGSLNDKLRGFYRSRFTLADGSEDVLAVTQFEATDARRAFPCWDEPAFKAVFQVTLVVEDGLAAISNTPIVEQQPLPGGTVRMRFAPTIPMSTYLLAFVVGRLEPTAAVRAGEIPIRVWAVPGKTPLGAFALEVGSFSLQFFQDYYGIPYPGEKLDLIAIPDFAFGAMENLGAITFRETALLVDPATATQAERTRVADVVAHEIAHMWFGDLVTMAWWNGLWLNEAFATFMEYQAVDAWKPAWGRWTGFGVSRAAAFLTDGLAASRPIEFAVVAPKDAEAMFDVLTYEKGAAVLRMLEQYLTPEVFRDGVRRYLKAHEYATAETGDLWKGLGEASGEPIPEIMDGWIFRQGYPLVSVRTDPAGPALVVSQRGFRYIGTGAGDFWQVPMTYRVRANGHVRHDRVLLREAETRIPLEGLPEWVVANEGGHGFYRVQYEPRLLAELLRRPAETLTPIERFNLIADNWAVTLAGLGAVSDYLDLTGRFTDEANRYVWLPLLASFGYLSRVLPTAQRTDFERLVRARLHDAVARLGWAAARDEDELTRQLRGDLLRVMGISGNDPACQAEAAQWLRSEIADPEIAAAAVAITAHVGGEAEYESFFKRFKTAKTPQEEQRYLHALAGFQDQRLVERTLRLAVSGEVRTQDAPFLVRELLMGVHSRETAWAFVKSHWEDMERLYPSQTGMRRLCEGITGLATPELERDVQQFFASHPPSFSGKTLDQYLEQLRIAVAFREREKSDLQRYLARIPNE